MASTGVKQNRMRRLESKKSHSWWWDSHISPKNSKWLQENLEKMDQNVKRMLKLLEEDADSFAKRAEIYYQKRPELIDLVEEFYRMYRSLAERYDNVTGELRKTIPSDLQSQGSGISDISSESPSRSLSPDQRLHRRTSGTRAAGFDFFLGAGGRSTDLSNKEGDGSSTSDSEPESEDSVNKYPGVQSSDEDQGLRRRVIELELEICDVKEKYQMLEEEISEGSCRGSRNGSSEILQARIAEYEEELKLTRETIRLSEEEISKLKDQLQKYKLVGYSNNGHDELDMVQKDSNNVKAISEVDSEKEAGFQGFTGGPEVVLDAGSKIQSLDEELKISKEKLLDSEKEVARLTLELQNNGSSIHHLQDQLGSAQKGIANWEAKLEKEKREVSELQDQIVRYKSNLSVRDLEINGLREAISIANKSLSEENSQLQAEIAELLKEKACLEDNLKEMGCRCQSLEEDVKRVEAGKAEMETLLGDEIEKQKGSINEKNGRIEELNKSLEAWEFRYDTLRVEKDMLDEKIATYVAEVSSKNTQIIDMNKHLHQLHMEHAGLIAGAEAAHKQVEELRSRVRELAKEVERQQEVILEGAEEKREAIRQLCFSLEHYRNGYHRLRQAVMGHKRLPVMAS